MRKKFMASSFLCRLQRHKAQSLVRFRHGKNFVAAAASRKTHGFDFDFCRLHTIKVHQEEKNVRSATCFPFPNQNLYADLT